MKKQCPECGSEMVVTIEPIKDGKKVALYDCIECGHDEWAWVKDKKQEKVRA